MAQGKGISDAVRGSIREWMTDRTVQILYKEYLDGNQSRGINITQQSFGYLIRDAEEWVRIVRRKGVKGFVRTYYSKRFPQRNVTLEIQTNSDDTHIEHVKVFINGRIIGGGRVKVPSVLVSQAGAKRKLDLELAFTPFTDDELKAIQAEMEHGEGAVFALLEERYV